MAKINFSFDTIDKTVVADVDGVKITTLDSMNLYRKCCDDYDSDKWELSMSIRTAKENGMRIMTYVSSKKQ